MFKRKKKHHTSYLLGGMAGGFIMGAGMYALTKSKAIKNTDKHTSSSKHDFSETMVETGDDIIDGMKDIVSSAMNEPSKKEVKKKEPELAKIIQKSLDHEPF